VTQAFESYIDRVQNGQLVKSDFLAAGYFFRGINAWILNRKEDAITWMTNGKNKFSDRDVYQVIVAPGDKSTIVDKALPARSSFDAGLKFLSSNPPAQFPDVGSLARSLQTM
jgi:hypothetical protein